MEFAQRVNAALSRSAIHESMDMTFQNMMRGKIKTNLGAVLSEEFRAHGFSAKRVKRSINEQEMDAELAKFLGRAVPAQPGSAQPGSAQPGMTTQELRNKIGQLSPKDRAALIKDLSRERLLAKVSSAIRLKFNEALKSVAQGLYDQAEDANHKVVLAKLYKHLQNSIKQWQPQLYREGGKKFDPDSVGLSQQVAQALGASEEPAAAAEPVAEQPAAAEPTAEQPTAEQPTAAAQPAAAKTRRRTPKKTTPRKKKTS